MKMKINYFILLCSIGIISCTEKIPEKVMPNIVVNDLSNSQPGKKNELLQLYRKWAEENQVLPFDSVKY